MAFQFAGRYIEALLKTSSGTVRLLAGVPIVIRETDGVTPATVYVDRTKAASASNPVVTDARGNLDAWLDPGSYLGYPVIAGVEQPAFPMHVEIDPAEADSPPAAEVSFAPAGGLAAVTVQAALVELDTEKASAASVVAVSAAVDAEEAARIAADALLVPLAEKGAPNGIATLGADAKLTAAQLPDLAISAFLGTTASQAAMLALDGDRGDWTVRTDTDPDTTWMLVADDPTQLANWRQMSTVTDAVSSVNGRLGAVVGLAEAADVTAEAAARVAADALLAPKASPTFTGTVLTPAATVSGKNGLAPRTFTGRKTTAGAPTTGTWAVDDEVIDSAGVLWRCTVAGTPGTWIQVTSTGTFLPDQYQDFTGLADGAISGVSPPIGSAWQVSGAVAPTVSGGRVFSTGSGYLYAALATRPTLAWADVEFGGSADNVSCCTIALTADASVLSLNDFIHVTFGSSGAVATVRRDGGAFETLMSPLWSRTCRRDGTRYRVLVGVVQDTFFIIGPNGEMAAINDPRVPGATSGKVVMFQASTVSAGTGKLMAVGAADADTYPGWRELAGSGLFALPSGSIAGRRGEWDEASIGADASSGGPALTLGPLAVPGRLTAAAIIGATTITVDKKIPPGSTILLGTGNASESVTSSGTPTGTGPYVVTVSALTKAHAIGENVYAVVPASQRGVIYFNPVNQTTNFPAASVFPTSLFIGDQSQKFVKDSADVIGLGSGDSLKADGTWNGGQFRMGNYRFWVDGSGLLRMKSSAPASDTDGTIVGTQS